MRRFSTILVACLTATLAFAGSSCGTPPSPRAAGTVAQTTALDAQAATAAPRAGTISLSLTSSGRLKLHIVAVDAAGRPVPSALRVTVGTTTKRGSGTVVRRDARTVHDLLLPGLRKPGGVYYYDVRLRAGDTGRTYPATGRYRVIAPVGAEQPLTMVAWSDSQPDSSSVTARPSPVFAKMIGNALAKRPRPALALVAGDVLKVDDDDPRQTLDAKYLRFLSVENRLARRLPVMIAPGNHEELGVPGPLAAWGRWLGLPTTVDAGRRFYSFTDGDVHVVALATAGTGDDGTIGYFGPGDKRNSAQARWLEDDLGAAGDRWTIVFAHHPLFDPKPDDPYATSAERDALNALFAASGVDLVIQGHLHSYRRHQEPVSFAGAAGSLTYVTHGGLGGDLRPTDYAPPDAYDVARDRAYTYLIVRSDGRGSLTGTTYAVDAVTGVETVLEAFAVDQVPRGAAATP